jgi:phosphatidylserine/phosphatidylglycerophosphate/cardiolipin synthase-like enzyme
LRRRERVYVSRIGIQTSPASQPEGAEFAERQTAVFNEDLKRSRRVTYEEWQNRSWTEKLSEHAEAWLNSQL